MTLARGPRGALRRLRHAPQVARGRRIAAAGRSMSFPTTLAHSTIWATSGPTKAKHLPRALAMIERAVAAEPENTAYRDSLGWVLFRLGRDEDAIAELKKAAAGDKPDATVLEHLGDVYQHVHKPSEALETLEAGTGRLRERQRRREDQSHPRQDRQAR